MGHIGSFQQAPVRNESVIGAQVYSHSGEFAPQVFDLELPARGVSFQLIRKYSSANSEQVGALGRGWTFTYAKRLVPDGGDVLYHDGFWRVHRFAFSSSDGRFLSPDGFYAVLSAEEDRFLLKQRQGDLFVFDNPASGGRLLAIEDRSGNVLRFEYKDREILATDPLGREFSVCLEQDRVIEVRDHTGRNWQYTYDRNACLVEVIRPPITSVPDRPRVRYTYDEAFRLASIVDPKGQTILRNTYNPEGRILRQEHGEGSFEYVYEALGATGAGLPVLATQVKLKNGGILRLVHDENWRAVESTLLVSASSLLPAERGGEPDEMVPLTTLSSYNQHGELVRRRYPAGNTTEWVYDSENADPRAKGNLLQISQIPNQGAGGEFLPLVTRYAYEPVYQQVSTETDPRGYITTFAYDAVGNLSRKDYPTVTIQEIGGDEGSRGTRLVELSDHYMYNEAGQIILYTDPQGSSIAYFYYPESDPSGTTSIHVPDSLVQTPGGYLARVVRDPATAERRPEDQPANLVTGFGYDDWGNLTVLLDGKGNPTRLEYDSQHNLLSSTSRQPFDYRTTFQYDANGNIVKGTLSFNHQHYDTNSGQVASNETLVDESFEYNLLNNIVQHTKHADDLEVTHTFLRDASENIVGEVLPLGNKLEYEYDERNQLVVRRLGVGSAEETIIRHTYTRNGSLSSTIDGGGQTTFFQYDPFHRYEGYTNPGGVVKKQWRDAAGNVTGVQVTGEAVSFDDSGQPATIEGQSLFESWFQYDELNRLVRADRAWRDAIRGEPLGKSRYDGKEARVSSVVQYGDNHLPAALWTETGNIQHLQFDRACRLNLLRDETGETIAIDYDENSNPIRIERLGPPAGSEERFRQVIHQQFDELDRVIGISFNEGEMQKFTYNSLGALVEYQNAAGASLRALQDSFGRFAGAMVAAATVDPITGEPFEQQLLSRMEWDSNGRLAALINAHGNVTRFEFDALNRLSAQVYADGAARRFERDGAGNVTRMIHPNGVTIANRYDALNRLVERFVEENNGAARRIESFQYDGLNRLVAARNERFVTLSSYDSLSRLLQENQSGRKVNYGYDSAGNQVLARYPGGQEVYTSFDQLRRVVDVRTQESRVASFGYGSSTQLRRQQLGEALNVEYTYEPGMDWLSSIVYRSAQTSELVEGNQYRYDEVGNAIQEVDLRRGMDTGDRYFYDSAERLVRVQYGVEQLSDPGSDFEQEVLYELGATGAWQRKTVRGAHGEVLEDAAGETNLRERYVSLGDCHFEYDANANRVFETGSADNRAARQRYVYDYANRLVSMESLDPDGHFVQTCEYGYDALNRLVTKQVTRDGATAEVTCIWNGDQLIEEWQDGNLAKSFIYGGGLKPPLMMIAKAGQTQGPNFYTLNGRDLVSGITDSSGKLVESYHFDPYLQLRGREPDGGRHIIGPNQLWDSDAELVFSSSSVYDPKIGSFINTSLQPSQTSASFSGEWKTNTLMNDKGTPSVKGTPSGFPPGTSSALGLLGATVSAAGLGTAIIGTFAGPLAPGFWAVGFAAGAVGVAIGGAGALIGYVDALGDDPFGERGAPRPGGKNNSGSSGPSGGSSQGSAGGPGNPSGQPEGGDLPRGGGGGASIGGGTGSGGEKGSSGGGSGSGGSTGSGGGAGGSSGGSSSEHTPVLDNDGNWYWKDTGKYLSDQEKADTAGKNNMPNPETGTGEGIDKDWWRSLPYASIFSVAEALRSPVKVDEREQTPYVSSGSAMGIGYLASTLAPSPVQVDAGGEGISINLKGVYSTSTSSGASGSDGWGDKPRTLAEAVAAPRVRQGAAISRF